MTTVLVADDEFDILEAVEAILHAEGYEVVTCNNGLDALAKLQDRKPHLLITDVMMPRLSGLEVLKRMQGEKDLKDTPTILMSCISPSVKQSDYGWTMFLRKPFSMDELTSAVEKILGKKR